MASESNAPNKDRGNQVGWGEDTQHINNNNVQTIVHKLRGHFALFRGNKMGVLVAAQKTVRYSVLSFISPDVSVTSLQNNNV